MVITTASKLMLANDEVEDLKTQLRELKKIHTALSIKYDTLESKYRVLKYDRTYPWWKFW